MRFDNTKGENLKILLVNPLGQTVKEFENITGEQVQIERDNLPGGIYFVQLRSCQKVLSTSKLIVR